VQKKILIVEDNNDSREIMNLFITKLGYQAVLNFIIASGAGWGATDPDPVQRYRK
jgi:hypothetical protein